jgi:hypothetical protein
MQSSFSRGDTVSLYDTRIRRWTPARVLSVHGTSVHLARADEVRCVSRTYVRPIRVLPDVCEARS